MAIKYASTLAKNNLSPMSWFAHSCILIDRSVLLHLTILVVVFPVAVTDLMECCRDGVQDTVTTRLAITTGKIAFVASNARANNGQDKGAPG